MHVKMGGSGKSTNTLEAYVLDMHFTGLVERALNCKSGLCN